MLARATQSDRIQVKLTQNEQHVLADYMYTVSEKLTLVSASQWAESIAERLLNFQGSSLQCND